MNVVRISIVIPVYNEGQVIATVLQRIQESVSLPFEVLVVHDTPEDTTVPIVNAISKQDSRIRAVLNTIGRGPANAIRFGLQAATAPVAVVTMADGCDDTTQIDDLARLVERGVVVACASRYARGGQQVGGPFLKGLISRTAGISLYLFARVGTRDATNSFKAYSRQFLLEVCVESDQGFEIGIELVAKARRRRLPVAEIPTIWLDRAIGVSKFRIWAWIPRYVRWYVHAFGRDRKRAV